jgi:L,D-transpeptidase YbiS
MSSIRIAIPEQALELFDDSGALLRRYLVSTSSRGAGERNGSHCTPRGRHVIRAKIGAGAPLNTVFAERRPTGEFYSPEFAARHPGRDWILTRILCSRAANRASTGWARSTRCGASSTSTAARTLR